MFIVFEGPDGSGKSTQLHIIGELLRDKGFNVIITREPGGVPFGEKLRDIMMTTKLDPRTELLLMMASRIQHVQEKITPALAAGKIVLCDRFTDSTYAYQGYAKGVSLDHISWIEQIVNAPVPDVVILFEHRYKPECKDQLEENISQEKVLSGFNQRKQDHWIIVESNSKQKVTEYILDKILKLLD